MSLFRLRMKSYIQPFEQRLAIQELRTLSSAEPQALDINGKGVVEFLLECSVSKELLARRLAFWECVATDDESILTTQVLRESTTHTARNGVPLRKMGIYLPFNKEVPLPNRRCLRYGPHGIHEYRGKFFPQLVRSLINISDAPPRAVVADPMSGSGTTLVETILMDRKAFGMDVNPLSVFLGQTKCRLLSADASAIARSFERIGHLMAKKRVKRGNLSYFSRLSESDQTYLRAWFSARALVDLDAISQAIELIQDANSRDLMKVSLSNVLRRVSWQKCDDLRVRKEIRHSDPIDARTEFLVELERSVRAVVAFLHQNGPLSKPSVTVLEGDARECTKNLAANSVDVVITSPPYATALPYLDTDRLSLCYLGLLSRPDHRARDQQMIGNREITESARERSWHRFESFKHLLPQPVTDLIRRIKKLNSQVAVGFRRHNLPSLLANYFFDMREVLMGIHRTLKAGSFAFVVVGNNHTIAGEERIEIETAKHLQSIGEMMGFRVAESLKMEMLVSRDIFRRNATKSEEILALYKRS